MPLYSIAVERYTPLIAGVAALPQSTTVVPCAAVVGLVAAKTGKHRWSLWAGWVLTVLGCGLLYILGVGTAVVAWIFLLLVSGIGIGMLFPAMNLAIQASIPPKDIAIAAGMFTFFRALGQTVGVAIGGVIFQKRMTSELHNYPNLTQYPKDAVSLIQEIRHLPAGTAQTIILKSAFANSIRTIWAVMCGLAGIALIASFFMKEYDVNQVLATEQRFDHSRKDQAGTDSEDVEISIPVKD
jgi:fucose permease